MGKKGPPLRNKIESILERDAGVPYSEVLERYSLTPTQFARAVKDLETLVIDDAQTNQILKSIYSHRESVRRLFEMEYEFLESQYDRVLREKEHKGRGKFYEGTLFNKQNVHNLIYIALCCHNVGLRNNSRKKVIESLADLPSNLYDYLAKELALGGLMGSALPEGERHSPLSVLKIFDGVYREQTEDSSLFDLDQEFHLHEWAFKVSHAYWEEGNNVERAVYHTLTEFDPKLKLDDRISVIETIKQLPSNREAFFREVGLGGLLHISKTKKRTKSSSPFNIIYYFDLMYQRVTRNSSLFDTTQEVHLKEWEGGGKAPQRYWREKGNVKNAVYSVLTEKHPLLSSTNREEVIEAIKQLPTNLLDYFESLGLGGLMANAFEGEKKASPLLILRTFDESRQERTGDSSLFDLTQDRHIKITKGRLNRKG